MSEILWPQLQDRELNRKPDTEKHAVFKWKQSLSQLQDDCKAEIKLKWLKIQLKSVWKAQINSALR